MALLALGKRRRRVDASGKALAESVLARDKVERRERRISKEASSDGKPRRTRRRSKDEVDSDEDISYR